MKIQLKGVDPIPTEAKLQSNAKSEQFHLTDNPSSFRKPFGCLVVERGYCEAVSRMAKSGNEHNVHEETKKDAQAEVSLERHYSVKEVSKLWGISVKTVRTLFKREPGVVEFGNGESRFKRVYVTRRIPESVVTRVHRRLRRAA